MRVTQDEYLTVFIQAIKISCSNLIKVSKIPHFLEKKIKLLPPKPHINIYTGKFEPYSQQTYIYGGAWICLSFPLKS